MDGHDTTTADDRDDDFGQVRRHTDGDGAKTLTSYDSSGRVSTVTLTQTDGTTTLGSTTYGYNGGTERRGLPTSITDSALGATTGSYGAGGNLTSQILASGLSQSFTTDPAGDTMNTTWTASGGAVFLADTQVSDIHGRWVSEYGNGLPWSRIYGYDPAGRLTSVGETARGTCTTRAYGFDQNSNRTSTTLYPADTGGVCVTTTTPTSTQTLNYDNADRLQAGGAATGIAYDAWGRIVTLPAALTTAPATGGTASNAGSAYYANDMARTLTQDGKARTWTLDPGGRLATMSTTGLGSTAQVNHYGDGSSDSPAWTVDTDNAGAVTTHRYVPGLAGYWTAAEFSDGGPS